MIILERIKNYIETRDRHGIGSVYLMERALNVQIPTIEKMEIHYDIDD